MKAAMIGILVGAVVAIAAAEPASMTESFALTTIDSLPTATQLDGVLGSDEAPRDRLISIAEDGSNNEPGVRLRAISALPRYCPCSDSDPVHIALRSLIPPDPSVLTDKDLVLLRATIESLAQLQDTNDTVILENLLNHPSRDIRASAARALATMCDTSAINALRVRYQNESTDQVKLVISATLRILSQPSGCPVN